MPHSSGGGSGGAGGSFGSSGGGSGSGSSGSGIGSNFLVGNGASGENWTLNENRRRRNRLRYAYYDRNGELQYFYASNELEKAGFLWVAIGILVSIFGSFLLGFTYIDPKPVQVGFHESVITDTANIFTYSEEQKLKESMNAFTKETGIAVEIHAARRSECEGYGSFTNYAYQYYIRKYNDEYHWVIIYVADDTGWRWEGMQGDNTDSILTKKKTQEFNALVNDCLSNRKMAPGEALATAFDTINPTIMKNDFSWKYKEDRYKIIALGAVVFISFLPVMFNYNKRKDAFLIDGNGRAYYD